MRILHESEVTKDGMLLWKREKTFIRIHKVIAGYGKIFYKLSVWNASVVASCFPRKFQRDNA